MDNPAQKETAKKLPLNSKFSSSTKLIMGKYPLTLLRRSMIFPEVQSIIGEKIYPITPLKTKL